VISASFSRLRNGLGIDLHHTLLPDGTRWTEVLRLNDLHRRVLHLLGPAYEHGYLACQETAE
jgi:hypothetical protein